MMMMMMMMMIVSASSRLDEIEKRERLFRTLPEHHPIYNDRSDFPDSGLLKANGLDDNPHQLLFDLLGHTLPKPLPIKQPCMFCRPPRDQPPEYYKLDYTVCSCRPCLVVWWCGGGGRADSFVVLC